MATVLDSWITTEPVERNKKLSDQYMVMVKDGYHNILMKLKLELLVVFPHGRGDWVSGNLWIHLVKNISLIIDASACKLRNTRCIFGEIKEFNRTSYWCIRNHDKCSITSKSSEREHCAITRSLQIEISTSYSDTQY